MKVRKTQDSKMFDQFGIHPLLRIGLLEDDSQIDFKVQGSFSISDLEDNVLVENISSPLPWRVKIEESKLELFDAEYDCSVQNKTGIRITPQSEVTKVSIFGVEFSGELGNVYVSDTSYQGTIEFCINDSGNLLGICELPVEEYLYGVITSELSSDLPSNMLKAQAIACRSKALAGFSIQNLNGSFNLNKFQAGFQKFKGVPDEFCSNAWEAINQTKGMVLFTEGEILDAGYNPICGGHLCARNEIVDVETHEPSLLSQEEEIKKWIYSSPRVYCNLTGEESVELLDVQKRYFRWEISYSRKELEEIILEKTKENIGILYEVIPIQREKNGSLKEIEIIGSRKNIRVKDSLAIRNVFSKAHLNSACFVIETEVGDDGTPVRFTFVGAGFGNGIGMCQAGAAVMALEGHSYKDILNYYYQDASIGKIY